MRSAIFVVLLAACARETPVGGVTPDGGAGDAQGSGMADGAPADATGDDADVAVEQDYDDVATALASVLRVPIDVAIVDGVNMAYGVPPAGFTNTATGVWSGMHDTIAYTYTYHCEDVNGADTYTCGPGTNHIHWQVAANGTAAMAAFNMTEDKLSAHWHIRDIDENKPRVEDIGQLWIAGRILADGARLNLTVAATWTTVRFDAQPMLPSGGTVTASITGHRSRLSSVPTDSDLTMTSTITFAAGQSRIDLDGTHSYALDMTTGAVTRM